MKNFEEKNEWKLQSENIVFESSIFKIAQQHCQTFQPPASHTFYVLKTKDWCNIIPVTADGKVILVKQYRVGIHEYTLEIPGGVADSGESLEQTALRELTEETGYEPLPSAKCYSLGWNYPNPAIQNNRCYSFLVGPVARKSKQNLDPAERIEVLEVDLEEIPQILAEGKIKHALILNAFFMLMLKDRKYLQQIIDEIKHKT